MPLKEGDKAPAFTAKDQHGDTVSSADLSGQHFVLYFYPRDQTPVCTKQACAFQSEHEEFKALGVPVLGVSTDSVGSHKRFAEKHGLDFPLLADTDGTIRDAYDAKGFLGRTTRITYLISPDGTIEGAHKAELSGQKHVDWVKHKLQEVTA